MVICRTSNNRYIVRLSFAVSQVSLPLCATFMISQINFMYDSDVDPSFRNDIYCPDSVPFISTIVFSFHFV